VKRAILISILLVLFAQPALAQDIDATFHRATITNAVEDSTDTELITIQAELADEKRGIELTIPRPALTSEDVAELQPGKQIIVIRSGLDGVERFTLHDIYRLDAIFWLFIGFVIITITIIGRQGIFSLVGLGITLIILVGLVAPLILKGYNPLLVSFLGALVIAGISILVAHGIKKRTLLALLSTVLTLGVSLILALGAVSFANLLGLGSEEAAFLKIQINPLIDVRGILLGAIIIGALGVLDDVTTAQTATVEEIHKANTKLGFHSLISRGMSVGREHIISLVNTLVLAYVGAAFPIFLLLTTASPEPLWVTLNAEFVSEELVRMLVGSLSLVLAVPISTIIAAWQYTK